MLLGGTRMVLVVCEEGCSVDGTGTVPVLRLQKFACAQRGARTHDPEIKSLMLYRLS